MTRDEVLNELHVAFKQSGETSVMFNEEARRAQAKGILHLCSQASKFDTELKTFSDVVWGDYIARAMFIDTNPPRY